MSAVIAAIRQRVDPAVATAFACILVLLFAGSLYSPNFLSPVDMRVLKL